MSLVNSCGVPGRYLVRTVVATVLSEAVIAPFALNFLAF